MAAKSGIRRWALLSAVLGLVACMGGAQHRPRPTGQPLTPDLRERASVTAGKFRVVFAGPKGAASAASEISVVFDRPLRALDRADAVVPELVLRPSLKGSLRWVGARGVVFVATPGLPPASEITVEVPKGLRALDGSELDQPYRFTFTTPRPRLVQSTPANAERSVLPGAKLVLGFNQRIAPKSIERWGRLKVAGRELAFRVEAPRADAPQRAVIVPQKPLPLDADVSFSLGPELAGEEGPLAAGTGQRVDFHTLGPLQVAALDCNRDSPGGRCMPGFGVGIRFTNAVRVRDLARAVELQPKPKGRWPTERGAESDSTYYLELPSSLAPGESYSLRVAAGISDVHGQKLAKDFATTFRMDDLFPRVAIGVDDGSVVPADRGPIPVEAVNARGAAVAYAALEPGDVLGREPNAETFAKLVSGRPGVARLRLPSGERNQPVRGVLDPKTALGPRALGVLGLVAEYVGDAHDGGRPPNVRLAKLSDLALSAKFSRHGSQVWVTRLSTAMAVAGASVEIVSGAGERHRYTSDSRGFVGIPGGDFAPNLSHDSKDRDATLLVRVGDEWTFERVSDVVAPWSLSVPTDPSGELHVEGFLFSDRGVYRPGDTVRVKGVVRRQTLRGTGIPIGEKLVLGLRSPDDDEVQRRELKVSRFGTFAAELKVPRSAGLGSYLLRATIGRDEIEHRVDVEEYRAQEFKVDVTAPKAAVRGDQIEARIHGTYLFGADMNGADARYRWIRTPSSFAPPGSEGFTTDASAYYSDFEQMGYDTGALAMGESKLDAHGVVAAPVRLALTEQRKPESLVLDAEVIDVARRSGAGEAQVLVHPAEFYLGLAEPRQFLVDAPGRVEPKVLAISPEGRKIPGVRVRLELVARRWTFAREDRGGVYPAVVSKVVDRVAASCEVSTLAAAASCALPIKEGGYYIVLARAEDARKNPIRAAHSFYALGGADAGFRVDDGQGVELVPDKKSYRVGETARVLVKSPFARAEALVSLERADVFRSERMTLQGATPTLSIPITEDMRPNAFVSVALFRPLGKNAATLPGGTYRIGYAGLSVEPDSRRLAVEVVPSATQLSPGDRLRVEVRVRDAEKKPAPAEVTLYAVDEGVLLLSGYQIPDPIAVFSRERPLGVSTLDTRTNIAKIGRSALEGQLGLGKGAEAGGGGESSTRRDFRATAYFNPDLVTDAQGVARAEFRLPDGLTSYRLMAVAVGNGDRFGAASSSVTASRPLMARPALPRLLRTGDELDAGVIVTAKDVDPGPVEVTASGQGLTFTGPHGKGGPYPLPQIVFPGQNGQVEVRFPLVAKDVGEAKLRFEVKGQKLGKDAVELRLPVKAPVELETVALNGSTPGAAAEALGSLEGVRPDVGELSVSVASTALVGLDAGAQALLEYPYECTEQLASRLLPLGALASLAADFGLPEASRNAELGALVAQKLSARQQGGGGFPFWDGGPSQPWLTAYALWALHEAKQHGVEVNRRVLERGQRYLRWALGKFNEEPLWLASAAYALDVLAELGAPDRGYMARVFDKREKLPLFARALLLHAFVVSKSPGGERAALQAELEAQIRVTGADAKVVTNLGDDYATLFDSEVRTQAMVLRALLAAQPGHPLAAPLARGLMTARRGGTWKSTQETAFALLALDAYRRASEARAPNFTAKVSLGEHVFLTKAFRGRSLAASSARLEMATVQRDRGALLGFDLEGSGTLFYEARLRYARREPPRAPFDAGFFVEKAFYESSALALSGAPVAGEGARTPQQRFRAGALVRVEVTLVSPEPREFVVIDDPLPAGFEAINTRFATTSDLYAENPTRCEGGGEVDDPGCVSAEHREFRDDRVLFFFDHLPPGVYRVGYFARASGVGRFVLPATRAEAMYAPEVFGRTAAGQVEVR